MRHSANLIYSCLVVLITLTASIKADAKNGFVNEPSTTASLATKLQFLRGSIFGNDKSTVGPSTLSTSSQYVTEEKFPEVVYLGGFNSDTTEHSIDAYTDEQVTLLVMGRPSVAARWQVCTSTDEDDLDIGDITPVPTGTKDKFIFGGPTLYKLDITPEKSGSKTLELKFDTTPSSDSNLVPRKIIHFNVVDRPDTNQKRPIISDEANDEDLIYVGDYSHEYTSVTLSATVGQQLSFFVIGSPSIGITWKVQRIIGAEEAIHAEEPVVVPTALDQTKGLPLLGTNVLYRINVRCLKSGYHSFTLKCEQPSQESKDESTNPRIFININVSEDDLTRKHQTLFMNWNQKDESISTVLSKASDAVSDAVSSISSVGDKVTDKVSEKISSIASSISAAGDKVTDKVSEEISSIASSISAAGDKVTDKVSTEISSKASSISAAGDKVTDKVSTEISSKASSISAAADKATDKVSTEISSKASSISAAGDKATDKVSTEISSLMSTLKNVSSSMSSEVQDDMMFFIQSIQMLSNNDSPNKDSTTKSVGTPVSNDYKTLTDTEQREKMKDFVQSANTLINTPYIKKLLNDVEIVRDSAKTTLVYLGPPNGVTTFSIDGIVDDTAILLFSGSPSTGFSWNLTKDSDTTAFDIGKMEPIQLPDLTNKETGAVGGSSLSSTRVTFTKPGKHTLTYTYNRTFESDSNSYPTKVIHFNIAFKPVTGGGPDRV